MCFNLSQNRNIQYTLRLLRHFIRDTLFQLLSSPRANTHTHTNTVPAKRSQAEAEGDYDGKLYLSLFCKPLKQSWNENRIENRDRKQGGLEGKDKKNNSN